MLLLLFLLCGSPGETHHSAVFAGASPQGLDRPLTSTGCVRPSAQTTTIMSHAGASEQGLTSRVLSRWPSHSTSPPTMGRFGNFFPKTDQSSNSQKGNCVATSLFGSARLLSPVWTSHHRPRPLKPVSRARALEKVIDKEQIKKVMTIHPKRRPNMERRTRLCRKRGHLPTQAPRPLARSSSPTPTR